MLIRLILISLFFTLPFQLIRTEAGPDPLIPLLQLILDWQAGDADARELLALLSGDTPMEETIQIALPGLPGEARPLVLVLVPGGSFTMGSPAGRSWADDDEMPQHDVLITKDLYFSETEITQAQYIAVVGEYGPGETPTFELGMGDDVPVYGLSWFAAKLFVDEINNLDLTEGVFRLPTEAEWEYACRAGTEGRFYFLEEDGVCFDPMTNEEFEGCGAILTANCWWLGSFPPPPPVVAKAQEVAQFDPNPFGLYDMTGNTNEWCEDRYAFDWYSQPEASFPNPENTTNTGEGRVIRGGSWSAGPDELHSSHRIRQDADIVGRNVGLRLVLER